MTLVYTGVGSRRASVDAMRRATRYATRLRELGWTLRSGRAKGMDQAFERGAGRDAHIFLPGPGFGGSATDWRAALVIDHATPEAYAMAESFHPNWAACNEFARACHARNCHQVLGYGLDEPSRFLVCWTPGGRRSGGTAQAMRIADVHDVPVFNLALMNEIEAMAAFIKEIVNANA